MFVNHIVFDEKLSLSNVHILPRILQSSIRPCLEGILNLKYLFKYVFIYLSLNLNTIIHICKVAQKIVLCFPQLKLREVKVNSEILQTSYLRKLQWPMNKLIMYNSCLIRRKEHELNLCSYT